MITKWTRKGAFFNKHFWGLAILAITLFAAFVRLYHLDTAPYGALTDEASYGYIAYSILETGRDELGNILPLHFKAFGDQKLPFYGYILVPIIKIFGLSNFAVRLPSAVFGILLVAIIYKLALELKFDKPTAFFGAMITVISPWTLMLSRFSFESNIALFLFTTSIFFAVKYANDGSKIFLFFAAAFLAFTWYTYIPYRIISLFLVMFTVIALILKNKVNIRVALISLLIFGALVAPLIPHTFSKNQGGSARLNQIGIFGNISTISDINEYRGLCMQSWPKIVCLLGANKQTFWVSSILTNQLRSLSPEFLFFSGEKNLLYISVPQYGLLSSVLFVFYILGIVFLFKKFKEWSERIFLLSCLFIILLPSALVGEPQRVRLSALYPFVLLIILTGYQEVLSKINLVVVKRLTIFFSYIAIFSAGFVFFVTLVSVHFAKFSTEYAGPMRGAIEYSVKNYQDAETYFESNMHNAIIHYAFYANIKPSEYQLYAKYSPLDSGNFSHPESYKNIMMQKKSFEELYCEHLAKGKEYIFITPENLLFEGKSNKRPVYQYLSFDKNSVLMNVYHISLDQSIKCSSVLRYRSYANSVMVSQPNHDVSHTRLAQCDTWCDKDC